PGRMGRNGVEGASPPPRLRIGLTLAQPTVHGNHLPGDKPGALQKKQHRLSDLFSGPGPSGRSRRNKPLDALIDLVERNHAGRNGIDRDLRGPCARQRARQHHDSGLGRAVMRVIRPGPQRAERTEIDDVSAIARQHDLRRGLAAKEYGFEVDGMNEVPIRLFDRQRIELSEPPRVVDEGVQTSEGSSHFLEHAPDIGHTLEVRAEHRRSVALTGCSTRLGFRPVVMNGHPRALRSSSKRNRAPNPFRGPGNEQYLIFHDPSWHHPCGAGTCARSAVNGAGDLSATTPATLHDATCGSGWSSSSSTADTSCRDGSGKRPVRLAQVQKTAVSEVMPPAQAPIVRGEYAVEAAPAPIIEIIIIDHCSDSSVANTRPRYRSSTCRSSCEKLSTELTAIAARDSVMNTQAKAIVGIWLNRMYAPPWITYAIAIVLLYWTNVIRLPSQ